MAGGLTAASRRGGRGRRSARRTRLSEINVTPFVDVMLVLLIVFMVTAPLLTVGVPIELPRTEAKQLESETEPLSISIRADGVIFVQDTVVDKERLVAQMRAISREGYDRRVFIRADATADYGLVADVMARLSASGFRNLGLVTDTNDGQRRRASSPEEREEE
jgi:biopolymer transport protein TolR